MSSITFQSTVTQIPADWANDVDALVYDIFAAAQTLDDVRMRLGLQSMASQDAARVAVTGGSIDGVDVGANTPLTQMIAQKGQVLDAPSSGSDLVNLDALRSFFDDRASAITSSFNRGLGSMSSQNKNNVTIAGGLIDGADIGTRTRAVGAFSALKSSASPSDGDDVVTLGWLTANYDVRMNAFKSMAAQDRQSVQIMGGAIDGTDIGLTTPADARFEAATIISAPRNSEDITNKRYVDSSISAFAATLGSMAKEDSTAIHVTGGAIEGTTVGATVASTGRFTSLAVTANQALITLNSYSPSAVAENRSGVVWQDGSTNVASFLYQGARSSVDPSILELSSSVPITLKTAAAGILLSNTNITFVGNLVSFAGAPNSKVVIGPGAAVTNMMLTVTGKAHANYMQAKRTLVIEGPSKQVNATYAQAASGVCPLDVNANAMFEVNVTGDMAFTLLPQDTGWPVNAWREIEILLNHSVGGKLAVFPASVKWGSGVAPDYSYTKAGDFDIVKLKTFDGITWYGQSVYANNGYFRLPSVAFMGATTGATSKIAWDVKDAASVTISGIGAVAASGQISFASPTTSVTYTLTAVGNDGRTGTASLVILPAA